MPIRGAAATLARPCHGRCSSARPEASGREPRAGARSGRTDRATRQAAAATHPPGAGVSVNARARVLVRASPARAEAGPPGQQALAAAPPAAPSPLDPPPPAPPCRSLRSLHKESPGGRGALLGADLSGRCAATGPSALRAGGNGVDHGPRSPAAPSCGLQTRGPADGARGGGRARGAPRWARVFVICRGLRPLLIFGRRLGADVARARHASRAMHCRLIGRAAPPPPRCGDVASRPASASRVPLRPGVVTLDARLGGGGRARRRSSTAAGRRWRRRRPRRNV